MRSLRAVGGTLSSQNLRRSAYIGESFWPSFACFHSQRCESDCAELVHESGKELTVAVNASAHQGMMGASQTTLDFLEETMHYTACW